MPVSYTHLILERSGKKDDFTSKYKMRLKFLDERRENCVQKRDWFEVLKYGNKLYAMKIKDDKNIRIIFSFVEYKDIKYAVLLHAFEEKTGKRKSPTSYDTAIRVAPVSYTHLEQHILGTDRQYVS